MKLISNLLGKKERQTSNENPFWDWFERHEAHFHKCLHSNSSEISALVDEASIQLTAACPDLYLLVGSMENGQSELIISAEGVVKNFALAEDLIAKAPPLPNWRFTALKKKERGFVTNMDGFEVTEEKLTFAPLSDGAHDNSIAIQIVHADGN